MNKTLVLLVQFSFTLFKYSNYITYNMIANISQLFLLNYFTRTVNYNVHKNNTLTYYFVI